MLCPVNSDTLSNGMVSYSPSAMPLVAGTVATYTCNTGYTLDGAATRTCVESTGWNITELPTCNSELAVVFNYFNNYTAPVVKCGALTNPTNGTVNTSSGITYQETATYTCANGYILNGTNNRTCQSDALWSFAEPTCDRECLNYHRFTVHL